MKKIAQKTILFLLVIITMLAICTPVKATASFGVELVSNATTVQIGQQVEITIKVKDIVDISEGVAGLSAKLEYDTTKLERIGEGESLNGFMLVEGDTIELAKYPGVEANTEIAKFTFKAKALGEAQIKLTEVEAANGTDLFELGKEVTKTITIAEQNNPIEGLSSNNNLSSLSVDGKEISNFNKETLTYTLEAVENSKTSIEITAETEDEKAKVTGTGTKNLKVGENSFEIVVTAEDGIQKSYKINIERKASSVNNENNNNNNNNNNSNKDGTQSTTGMPYAGAGTYMIIGIIGTVVIIGIISFIKTKKLSGV